MHQRLEKLLSDGLSQLSLADGRTVLSAMLSEAL